MKKERLSDLYPNNTLIKEIDLSVEDHLLFTTNIISKDDQLNNPLTTKRVYRASENQLASILAGSTPKGSLKSRVKAVWHTGFQFMLLNIIKASTQHPTAITIEDLNQSSGVIFMASDLYKELKLHNYLQYKEENNSNRERPFYQDLAIIIDDRVGYKSDKSSYPVFVLEKDSIKYKESVCADNTYIGIDETLSDNPTTLYTGKDMFIELTYLQSMKLSQQSGPI